MNKDILITYAFYDKQGRRCAIFGLPIAQVGEFDKRTTIVANGLMIYVIPCSKKDTFSKWVAKDLFAGRHIESVAKSMQVFTLTGITDEKFKAAFMNWCKANYQKPVYWNELVRTKAVKNGKKTLILSKDYSRKLGFQRSETYHVAIDPYKTTE